LEAAGAGFIEVSEEDKAVFMGEDWAGLGKQLMALVREKERGWAHNDPATTQLITTNESGENGCHGT
jgi:hypothetical protein